MTDIEPKGENVRKAIRWIGERRQEDPGLKLPDLITEAGQRFDLSPGEQETLFQALVAARKRTEKE